MRGFGPSNVFHYFSTMHPKPNELFSGSAFFQNLPLLKWQMLSFKITITRNILYVERIRLSSKGFSKNLIMFHKHNV